MKQVIFVHGPGGSGKTFYSIHECQRTGARLMHCDSKKENILETSKFFDDEVKIYDGLHLGTIEQALEFHKNDSVKHVVMLVPYFFIEHGCSQDGRVPSPVEHCEYIYGLLEEKLKHEKNVLTYNMMTGEHGVSTAFLQDFQRLSKEPTKQDVLDFKEELFEERYHDMILPGEIIKGVTPVDETWGILKEICDFNGKIVVDVGACTGYICHKLTEDHARTVIGTENHGERLSIGQKLAWLNQKPYCFWFSDACKNKIGIYRDVTLVLNIYHWFPDKEFALNNIFDNTRTIIFEINNENMAEIKKYAKDHGFLQTAEVIGRINRHILRFDRK